MAPRTYHLGKRADAAAVTRARILRAAAGTFQERGLAGTSMAAVAQAADVSRGTVVNHFGSVDGLLGAVLEEVVAGLELPDGRILDGAIGREDRIRRFVEALCRFYERSTPWWQTFGRGFEDHPVYKEQEAAFWARIHELGRQAIGPSLDDRIVGTAVWTLLHPWPFGQLRWMGLTIEESVEVLVRAVLAEIPGEEGRQAS